MHKIYHKDKLTNDLAAVVSSGFNSVQNDIDYVYRQNNLFTADNDGLEIFERDLAIKSDFMDIEKRKQAIKNKLIGVQKVNAKLLQDISYLETGEQIEISIEENGLNVIVANRTNTSKILEAIKYYKPAHLDVKFKEVFCINFNISVTAENTFYKFEQI